MPGSARRTSATSSMLSHRQGSSYQPTSNSAMRWPMRIACIGASRRCTSTSKREVRPQRLAHRLHVAHDVILVLAMDEAAPRAGERIPFQRGEAHLLHLQRAFQVLPRSVRCRSTSRWHRPSPARARRRPADCTAAGWRASPRCPTCAISIALHADSRSSDARRIAKSSNITCAGVADVERAAADHVFRHAPAAGARSPAPCPA